MSHQGDINYDFEDSEHVEANNTPEKKEKEEEEVGEYIIDFREDDPL